VLSGVAWSISAQAASFDCAKASSKMERLICSDTELSALDESLGKEYQSARARLSVSAAKTFVNGQLTWLRFHSNYCFISYDASPADRAQAKRCFAEAYSQRIKELRATGHLLRGMKTFVAIEAALNVSNAAQSIYVIQRNYLQLDSDAITARKINHYLAFRTKIDPNVTSGYESYIVRLIDLSQDWLLKTNGWETMMGAYPSGGTECGVYALSLDRPLRIQDVFSNVAWKAIAKQFTEAHFRALAKEQKDFDVSMLHGYAQFDLAPSAEFTFCLDADGFNVDGFLPHVARALDGVTLPWSIFFKQLTPYAREQILTIKR
jgi:uncharacterized protein